MPLSPGDPLDERDAVALNLANWDERAAAHAASPDYALDRFTADPAHLSEVVRFDRARLGDLTGVRGVHLQCHLGTDTLSLARLGARMSGVDFSPAALAEAAALADRTGAEVDFHRADVSDPDAVLAAVGTARYDLVYTGVGALCWLPDVSRWAQLVAALLAPGGRLFLREGHPVLWATDLDRTDGLLVLALPYFERPEPVVWDEPGSYVETDVEFAHTRSAEWNHGTGEIITALLDAGLVITGFEEHRSLPWRALERMEAGEDGEWRLPGPEAGWIPLSYTLQAVRPR